MPLGIAHGMELHPIDEARKKSLQPIQIRQRSRIAAVCFYDPLTA
jgi:hypothetical protein